MKVNKIILRENYLKLIISAVLVGLNIYVGFLSFTKGATIFWLSFVLVWFDLLFGWIVQKRQIVLALLFWLAAFIILILAILFNIVILGRSI
ncbi:hypothetical protein COT77_03425 [Candidatus Berkelbacteria bacterium CG10_big_fil_rev_8_21_14_0_10_41_12]|uniref:Uncharacterized protein n=1 Tax=Candidatus Berkelbacteria bacterium CG10_big_fil_rev_8_21_14_0_10_41_12 TaxID=1974513 RepID=A0A2M6WWB4_9BACT|nr:MAG: hypothetical protein COT77_03425 [Candidatus Berkelbacteria bacterium CG10_big_fil_rev_8_21_14_0_10_41_12]